MSFEPGDALAYLVLGHRQEWDGSVCEDAEGWECGAPKAFREEFCAAGKRRCTDLAALSPHGPKIRIDDSQFVNWLNHPDHVLEGQLLFLLGPSRRTEENATRFVHGVWVIGNAPVRPGIDDGEQAILEPTTDRWAAFPPYKVAVSESGLVFEGPRTGRVTKETVREWLYMAGEVGRRTAFGEGWTEEHWMRLKSFCDERGRLLNEAAEFASVEGNDLTALVATPVLTSAAARSIPAEETPSEETLPTEAVEVSPPLAEPDDPKGMQPAEDGDATPPWTAGEALPAAASIGRPQLRDRLVRNGEAFGFLSEDLLALDVFLRAGEVVWVLGEGAERAVAAFAHATTGGRTFVHAVGPTTLTLDDLWRDAETCLPCALARGWRFAECEPERLATVHLAALDSAPFGLWLRALTTVMRSDRRPRNLLVVATGTGAAIEPPASLDLVRHIVPLVPRDAPNRAVIVSRAALSESRHALDPAVLVARLADLPKPSTTATMSLATGSGSVENAIRAARLLGAGLWTRSAEEAVAAARSWNASLDGNRDETHESADGFERSPEALLAGWRALEELIAG